MQLQERTRTADQPVAPHAADTPDADRIERLREQGQRQLEAGRSIIENALSGNSTEFNASMEQPNGQ